MKKRRSGNCAARVTMKVKIEIELRQDDGVDDFLAELIHAGLFAIPDSVREKFRREVMAQSPDERLAPKEFLN